MLRHDERLDVVAELLQSLLDAGHLQILAGGGRILRTLEVQDRDYLGKANGHVTPDVEKQTDLPPCATQVL